MASTAMVESAYLTIAQNLNIMAVRAPIAKSGEGFSQAFMDYLKVIYTPEKKVF
jgi:hypothetical protein